MTTVSNVVDLHTARTRRPRPEPTPPADRLPSLRRITEARQRSGLTPRKFAQALTDEVGWPVTPDIVQGWETVVVAPLEIYLAAHTISGMIRDEDPGDLVLTWWNDYRHMSGGPTGQRRAREIGQALIDAADAHQTRWADA